MAQPTKSAQDAVSLSDLLQQFVAHPDAAPLFKDPDFVASMNSTANAAAKILMAQSDLLGPREQAAMKEAGVGTIAHPEFDDMPAAPDTDAVSKQNLEELQRISDHAVAASTLATPTRTTAKQPDMLEGIFEVMKKQIRHAISTEAK